MTDKEKIRAYDEALERAKKLHEDAITLQLEQDIKDYEYIFPELAESKDERIRKEFCKDIWTYIPNEKAHKYIAWLEKQVKQKPKWSEEDERIRKALVCHISKISTEIPVGALHRINGVDIPDILAWLEKQGEKKSKWSEEKVLNFINSLPEEPASNDLDFQTFCLEMHGVFSLPSSVTKNTEENPLNWEYEIAKHFAQWQKERLINKACEWLEKESDVYIGYYDKQGLVDNFRKAMEGEE